MSTSSSDQKSESFSEVPFSIVLEVDNFLENIESREEKQSLPISLHSGNIHIQLCTTLKEQYFDKHWRSCTEYGGELTVCLKAISVKQEVYLFDMILDIFNNSSYNSFQVKEGTVLELKRVFLKNISESQTLLTFTTTYKYLPNKPYNTFPGNHPGRKFIAAVSGIMQTVNKIDDVTHVTKKYEVAAPSVLHKSRICENLLGLFNVPNFSDIEVCVGENNFSVHKCILTSRSPGFTRIIKEFETKSNPVNIITINDFSADVVKEGLRFIYTGCTSPGMTEMVCELLQFAGKYEIEDLKSVCESEIKAGIINVDNVCRFAGIAYESKALELQKHCSDFIIANMKDVTLTEGWKKLKQTNPDVVVSMFEAMAL